MRVRVSIGKTDLLAEMSGDAFEEIAVEEGAEVHVVIKLLRLRP